MDYGGILKRAWNVTWKYKILWLFGLFAGGVSGNRFSSGSSSTGTGTSGASGPFGNLNVQQLQSQLAPILGILAIALVVGTVIGILFLIVGIAARGGLVYLVNEAEENRPVRAGEGWKRGFHVWWRTFAMQFLLGFPAFVVTVGFLVAIGLTVVNAVKTGGPTAAGPAVLSAVGGTCFLIVIFVVAAIAYALIIGPVNELALRYIVLKDYGSIEAIKSGWSDLWGKRGAFAMFMLEVALVIAVALVLVVVFTPFTLLAVALGSASAIVTLPLGLVGLFIGAVSGAYFSSMWTIFFRRMTGMERIGVPQPAWAGPPSADRELVGFPPPASSFPPPPPVASQEPSSAPPAPPVAPVSPAPPAPAPGGDAPPAGGQPATGDPKNPWEF